MHDLAAAPPSAPAGLAATLGAHATMLLTTYRKDGTTASSPVSVAIDGRRVFFRSYAETWKARRMRREPRVLAAPSTFRGRAIGPALPARARLLEGADAAAARRALVRRRPVLHGLAVPLAHRIAGYHTQHYELFPRDAD